MAVEGAQAPGGCWLWGDLLDDVGPVRGGVAGGAVGYDAVWVGCGLVDDGGGGAVHVDDGVAAGVAGDKCGDGEVADLAWQPAGAWAIALVASSAAGGRPAGDREMVADAVGDLWAGEGVQVVARHQQQKTPTNPGQRVV